MLFFRAFSDGFPPAARKNAKGVPLFGSLRKKCRSQRKCLPPAPAHRGIHTAAVMAVRRVRPAPLPLFFAEMSIRIDKNIIFDIYKKSCELYDILCKITKTRRFCVKLTINGGHSQGDPYVIRHGDRYYLYATGSDGVQLYTAHDKTHWQYEGICFARAGEKEYWAPAVLFYEGRFWLYYSSMGEGETDTHRQHMCVAVSDRPDGGFVFAGELIPPFSIDAHVVLSGGELYMFYSTNDYEAERAGTLIVLDKMKSPTEMCGKPQVVVRATLDEEIFMRDRFRAGQHWHTLEGAFYFRVGDWHYLTYSGNCYQNETYYIGYATAFGHTDDLTELHFRKYPDEQTYCPLVARDDREEGTGHNSILEENGHLYLFYHGRDWGTRGTADDVRTARLCEIAARDGRLEVLRR